MRTATVPRVSSSSIVVLLSVDSLMPSFFLVIMPRPTIERRGTGCKIFQVNQQKHFSVVRENKEDIPVLPSREEAEIEMHPEKMKTNLQREVTM